MKKLLLLSAVASALSANVQAQTKDNEKWVAGFIEYYKNGATILRSNFI